MRGKLECYLTAAFRHLIKDRLYVLITVTGLGLGFCAALLIAVFIRDENTFDHFIPAASDLYTIYTVFDEPGRPPLVCDSSSGDLAAPLRLEMPQIDAIAQLLAIHTGESLRSGTVLSQEPLYWADPNTFSVMRLETLAGDPVSGLQRPDGLVLTRRIARKYFGTDAPIGRTLEIVGPDHHPLSATVTAVLRDFPSSSNLVAEVFASGTRAGSPLVEADMPVTGFSCSVHLLIRLRKGRSAEGLQHELQEFLKRHKSDPAVQGGQIRLLLRRMTEVHLTPSEHNHFRPPGSRDVLYSLAVVGMLILIAATTNYVNLITARATQRRVEIVVRKAVGARRRDLFIQFIGESLLYATLGMLLGTVLLGLSLPWLNAFVDRQIELESSAGFLLRLCVGFVLVVGLLGGIYPALVVSNLPLAASLKGKPVPAGSELIREALIVVQFATLIGLIIATGVIYQQTRYALNEATRVDKTQVWVVGTTGGDGGASEVYSAAARRLPGVAGVTRSSPFALDFFQSSAPVVANGASLETYHAAVAIGFFEFYGLTPLAGRFFSADHPSDVAHVDSEGYWTAPLVINARAAHLMGFRSAQAAIGQSAMVTAFPPSPPRPSIIIGVVPDFELKSLKNSVNPTVYYVDDGANVFQSVRVNGLQVAETLQQLDALGLQVFGGATPPTRTYLEDRLRQLNLSLVKGSQLFAVFAVLAMLIACLGLLGLSAFTAERRTKEIGVRKALGATTPDVLRLLMLKLIRPVLWATLLAWPITAIVMTYWLRGFAHYLPLDPRLFLAGSLIGASIAGLTVLAHCLRVTRASPVHALRYE